MSVLSQDRIRALEEGAFNAWPARESVECDGWVFRSAEGYTKRANSANAVAPTGEFSEVQATAEAHYEERRQPTIFRLTRLAPHDADGALAASGYRFLDPSIVMTVPLEDQSFDSDGVTIESTLTPEWGDGFSAAANISPKMRPLHDQILTAIAPATAFAISRLSGAPVGYGLAVTENGVTGLFDIVVMQSARGRGAGRVLTTALLQWGRSCGAREAYLQVMSENQIARSLYASLGFTEAYRYHYRIKTLSS